MTSPSGRIERQYWDISGKQHIASPDVISALLNCLGPSDSENPETLIPPTLVVSETQPEFPLSVPVPKVLIDLELETGERKGFELPAIEKIVRLPDRLPLGYHRLRVTLDGQTAHAHLIVCPDRAYQPAWLEHGKAAGLAVSLYGLRSEENWGCGDTRDLRALLAWAASELHAAFVGLNPLHAIANRQPYNTSPYLPNSIFYRNHIYLDIPAIEDFAASSCAQALSRNPKIQAEIATLRASRYVEYERVSRLKLRFLKVLYRAFRKSGARAQAFQEYIEREGDLLHRFAVHSALDEALHKKDRNVWNWQGWPAEYQDPESAATRAFAQQHSRSVLFYKYMQWQLDLQFAQVQEFAKSRGMAIGLYHDLALATDRFGSDLWAHRQFYAQGCRVGAPPDGFSPNGQDWAFPPPNSQAHVEDGYQLFAQSIRKASAHGGALRIDHVMRFFRLFWIPEGKAAIEGTYVQDRAEDLVRVLALESVRGRFIVIGEDLGTVPDYVRDTLREFSVLSYRLFFFERERDGQFKRPDEYPRQALVSASTHDLPTLAGYWQNADIEARRTAGIIPDEVSYRQALDERLQDKQKILNVLGWSIDARYVPELTGDLHNAIIGFLASTPCELFGIDQEDLFKDTAQQNLPGTTTEHPNWRHKMKYTLEELHSPEAKAYTAMARSWIERTGRVVVR